MNGRNLARRDLLKAAGLAGLSGLAAACGATPASPTAQPTQAQVAATEAVAEVATEAPPEPTQSTEPTSIGFWFYWGGIWGEACTAVGKAFTEANPEIQVESVPLDGAWEKVLSAFAANDPPDVLLDYNAPQLMPRGQVLAMDDLIAAHPTITKDNYYKEMWETFQWDGAQYGLPAAEAGVDIALLMNKGRCAEAGLDVNAPPETVSELLAWAEPMTKVGDGGVLTQIGLDPWDGTSTSWCDWAALYGFNWWDPTTREFDWHSLLDCLTWQSDWIKKWGAKNFEAFRSGFGGWLEPDSSVALGTQAMHMNGYWTPGELAHKAAEGQEFAYTWAPRPDNRRDVHVQISQPFGIFMPVPANNPQAAFKMIEWVCSDDANAIFYDMAGGFAWTKSWLAKVDTSKYQGLDFYVKSIAEADEFYCNVVNCPIGYNFAWEQWNKALNGVIYDNADPAQMLAEAEQACTDELARVLGS